MSGGRAAVVPLAERVLFPGGLMNVILPASTSSRFQTLLSQSFRPKSSTPLLVAAVPIVGENAAAVTSAIMTDASAGSSPLPDFGCLARVTRVEQVDFRGGMRIVLSLEGQTRVSISAPAMTDGYLTVHANPIQDVLPSSSDEEFAKQFHALRSSARSLLHVLVDMHINKKALMELDRRVGSLPASNLADLLVSTISSPAEEKLALLGEADVKTRVARATVLVDEQTRLASVSQSALSLTDSIAKKEKRRMELRKQMQEIRKELGKGEGDDEDDDNELQGLAKKLESLNLKPEVNKVVQRNMKRLERTNPNSAEYASLRDHLEHISELPWPSPTPPSTPDIDIDRAQRQLDDDHYGLDKVKRRIVEYLAVRKLRPSHRGPILCLIGPPGVGKTSLGRSIADALGRKFARISLGGVSDEADIRGHRRTYVGAMPGRVVAALAQAGSDSPVVLLDEIDKLGKSHRGDPAAALLEVLDPEQNGAFTDHYLGVPFSLEHVLFIATANSADEIPPPLADRMEIIRIPGYTFEEKVQIAKRYLFPKHVTACGLEQGRFHMSDDVIYKLALNYTREPGVRSLERQIAAVCRGFAVDIARGKGEEVKGRRDITYEDVERILGAQLYDEDWLERTAVSGVVMGLAWTSSGAGSVLFVETTQMPGKGRLILTGQLGDVMRESAQAAISWVRSNSPLLSPWNASAAAAALDTTDIHIHFPAGAIPKDGPSAGVTILTSLVSLLSGVPVRPNTAMTGEVTLRGVVLPVGGIRDKVLAAHRRGVKRVILPAGNRRDVEEVPEKARREMEFVFVRSAVEVLEAAIERGEERVEETQIVSRL